MIETARLILRDPIPADYPALRAMWADPAVMADLAPVKSEAESDATIARHDSYRAQGLGFWSTIRKDDGAVIGFCGLKPGAERTPIEGEIEIGWMLAQAYWGSGYALEAARASLAHGWSALGARRIVAITAERNAKSRALMVRLGMAQDHALSFDHLLFAPEDPMRKTVTYTIARPAINAGDSDRR